MMGAGSLESTPRDNQVQGRRLFEQRCSTCHENSTTAQRVPNLSALTKLSPEEIFNALTIGPMSTQAQGLSDINKRNIAEFLSDQRPSVSGSADTQAMPNQCSSRPPLTDPYSAPMWNGWGVDIANARFQSSKAAGITANQVPTLKLKWAFGFPNGIAFSQPTIVSGRVFIGSNNGYVYSLEASTGCVFWSFRAESGIHAAVSIGPAKGKSQTKFAAYFADMKANVYAVDAASGQLLWETRVDNH